LPDGTYITILWLTVFFVPIFSIKSVRVLEPSAVYGSAVAQGQSLKVQHVPLDTAATAENELLCVPSSREGRLSLISYQEAREQDFIAPADELLRIIALGKNDS